MGSRSGCEESKRPYTPIPPAAAMRIPIREQLALLILLASLVSLAVISIATWVTNHNFVLSVRSSRLALTASLKAAQLASNLNVMQTSANFVSTRVLVQSSLQRYNNGNNTDANWVRAQADLEAAIGGGGSLGQSLLLQCAVFPKNGTGLNGPYRVLNATSTVASDGTSGILLPYYYENGTQARLGDDGLGYPPALYPNFTFIQERYNSTFNLSMADYDGDVLDTTSAPLLIGPWLVNDTFSMLSLTMPIINNTSNVDILGFLVVVMDARLIGQVLNSREGLDNTGQTLLIGPPNSTNHFKSGILYNDNGGKPPSDVEVQFVTPLASNDSDRHPDHVLGSANKPFQASQYAAIQQAITHNNGGDDNSGSLISTKNENGDKVSVGFASPQTDMVDWVILVEQARSEVWQPINHLRDILLACVFATVGFMAIIAFPLAHVASLPIRRLREATAKSIEPPNSHPSRSSLGSFESMGHEEGTVDGNGDPEADAAVMARKEGYSNPVSKWQKKRRADHQSRREERRKRAFRIPGKVKERKHFVKDELSDLTQTFNEMSDELMMQYEKLEERVQQRTAELELSKKAAEAANESKTLFIANISHELKTPLNGILGMCAVCMQEDDPTRLKRSLGIIYKSGDLLLNLLTDLLTFSKNQVGQHLSLEEKEFRLRDVSSQILAIFDKQAKDGQIDLKVHWEGATGPQNDDSSPERPTYGSAGFGPAGFGRIKDMILYSDVHRILQVVINLVSNSLKFTPPGGSVTLTIRCLPDMPDLGSRKSSFQSKQSRQRSSRHKNSDATVSVANFKTASAVDAKGHPLAHAMASERAASPPPGRFLWFEFEVTDTGPGISEDLQQRIFEPFVQGDLGLSKKFGGTGLGLAICSQLASLMRGTIGVRSTPGVGSTFTVKLPLRHVQSRADSTASSSVDLNEGMKRTTSLHSQEGGLTPGRRSRHLTDGKDGGGSDSPKPQEDGAVTPGLSNDAQPRLVGLSQPFFASSQPMESPGSQPAAMEKITAEATRGGKIRVLVAEDNKVNQEVVLRMLKLEDIYDVTVAKDGQEALDMVKESMGDGGQPYNLIFMDVQMPNVDGLQSTKMIREIGYQAPIVALTAFAEESNIKDCMDSGMNYFLSKPIRRPQLKKVLKEYCAPIPEENEDITPPEASARRASVSQNTTIVMVNGVAPSDANGQPKGSKVEEKMASDGVTAAPSQPVSTNGETGDEPVSPLSKP